MAGFAEFAGGGSDEDDAGGVFGGIGCRTKCLEICPAEQEWACKVHCESVAPLIQVHVGDGSIICRPDTVVDDQYAHRASVLFCSIIQQVLDTSFVADIGLDGDYVCERCKFADVAVVMSSHTGS